jgi:hypothetical protein
MSANNSWCVQTLKLRKLLQCPGKIPIIDRRVDATEIKHMQLCAITQGRQTVDAKDAWGGSENLEVVLCATDKSSNDTLAALMYDQSEIKFFDEFGEITTGRFKSMARADRADEQIVVTAI